MKNFILSNTFVAALILLAPTSIIAAGRKGGTMVEDVNRIDELFRVTKTVCVGRFLLQVPPNSDVLYGPAWVNVHVERLVEEAANIQHVIDKSIEETNEMWRLISGFPGEARDKVGKLVAEEKFSILYGLNSGPGYRLESFVPVGRDLYVLRSDSWDIDRHSEDLVELAQISKLITARADSEIPTTPGVCVDGAFIPDARKIGPERVTVGVRLRGFKDVHFSLAVTTKDVIVQSDGLDERLKSAERAAASLGRLDWYKSIKVFRKRNRKVGAWQGLEVLARKPRQKGETSSHEFAFVSHGEPNNPMLPVLDVEMLTGVQDNRRGALEPSVTDAEAMEIWDRLVNSIRPRPLVSNH